MDSHIAIWNNKNMLKFQTYCIDTSRLQDFTTAKHKGFDMLTTEVIDLNFAILARGQSGKESWRLGLEILSNASQETPPSTQIKAQI